MIFAKAANGQAFVPTRLFRLASRLPAALAQAKPGGTLNWAISPVPASIVPLTTTAGGNTEIGPKIVEGLLTYDPKLNPKPLLATAWSVSKDGLQYRFDAVDVGELFTPSRDQPPSWRR